MFGMEKKTAFKDSDGLERKIEGFQKKKDVWEGETDGVQR